MHMSTRQPDPVAEVASGPLQKCGGAIDNAVSSALSKWGSIVGNHTWKVFIGSLLLVLILAGGVSMVKEETETGNLWTPSGSQVLDDRDIYEEFFGTGNRLQTIYVKAEKDGDNVITPDVLGAAREIHDKIRNNQFTVTVDGEIYGYEQLCERSRPTDPCDIALSPVDDLFYDAQTRTLSDTIPESVQRSFAGVKENEDGKIVEASTIKLEYFLSRYNDTNRKDGGCMAEEGSGGSRGCNPTLVWEGKLIEMLEEYADKNSKVRVYVEVESSISMVLSSIIGGDLIGLQIGFMCIVLYAVLVLGNFHPVLSRAAVAFCGVVCVGFAILGTYGIAGYCNVPITPVTSLLPFILVGIGVDDMFVLVGALNRAPKHLDTTTRISMMMRDAGSSITMTSLTDMLAFALGTTTSFPALRYFCIYAAIGIMLDFLFQCSLFVCALVWDEQRQKARGVDCFCCVAPCAKEGETCACCYVKEEDMGKTCCSGKCCMKEGGYLRGFISNTYAPLLKNVGVKVAVLLLAIAFFAVGIVGMSKLKEDFSLRYFVPSDDPLQEVFDITDKEFRSGETMIQVLLDHRPGDDAIYFHQPAAVSKVDEVTNSVETFIYYEPNTLISPLDIFMSWLDAKNTAPPSDIKEFYDELHLFLRSEGGMRLASMVSVYDWYAGFSLWLRDIQGAPGVIDGQQFTPDDFFAETMRPKDPKNMCFLLKTYFLSEYGVAKDAANSKGSKEGAPDMDRSSETCYPEGGDVQMHRVRALMKCALDGGDCPQSNATAAIEIMDGLRSRAAALDNPLDPLPYSYYFLGSEQFKVVRREAVTNISLALVAVAIVTLLLLAHVFAGMIVVVNVGIVLVDIVGLMWVWDITINSVSIINLVLAIGLAVDYSAHIAHAFMHATGSRDERMVTALSEMGADVAHGAVSTFVAVLVTAGSKSYIFQVFFRQFFGICFFGIIHGLVVLPVVLSLIGPASTGQPSGLAAPPMDGDVEAAAGKRNAVASDPPATVDSQQPKVPAPNLAVAQPTMYPTV